MCSQQFSEHFRIFPRHRVCCNANDEPETPNTKKLFSIPFFPFPCRNRVVRSRAPKTRFVCCGSSRVVFSMLKQETEPKHFFSRSVSNPLGSHPGHTPRRRTTTKGRQRERVSVTARARRDMNEIGGGADLERCGEDCLPSFAPDASVQHELG